MEVMMAFVIGGLFASGIYLMLRRRLAQIVIGIVFLTNATNLLIFTAAGLTRARPPLVPEGMPAPPEVVADPLPQALILTAIVIGFGVLAFALALAYRVYKVVGTDDIDAMRTTDT